MHYCVGFLRLKREDLKEELRKYISTEMASLGNLIEDERIHELTQYSLKAVQAATNNLSEENKLGRGGFGLVYKGELNGRLVAVKTFDQRSGPGNGFMNEIILMTRLQHKNLVRLLGCCIERGEKMLIYEFMTNGSLAAFFYDPEKRKSLDWETRFNTIMGSARAILYLHRDSQLNIIHRNIKGGNVLLDEQMTAKISGFEIARIFSGDNDPITTDCIAGTYGYIAPEHYNSGQLSTKSDVYSFGILLLEIVSGQTCSGFPSSPMGCCLNEYAWTLWGNGTMSDLIDPVLGESAPTSQILRCLHIGLLCIQEDPAGDLLCQLLYTCSNVMRKSFHLRNKPLWSSVVASAMLAVQWTVQTNERSTLQKRRHRFLKFIEVVDVHRIFICMNGCCDTLNDIANMLCKLFGRATCSTVGNTYN